MANSSRVWSVAEGMSWPAKVSFQRARPTSVGVRRRSGLTLIQEAVLIGHRIVVLSPGPGRIREIVDARGVEQAEDSAAIPLRQHLRELLEAPGAAASGVHPDAYE
jgi:hypothetical protein